MFKYLLVAILGFTSVNAFARCYGSDTYYNCYDLNSGNDYTIRKYGNTTYMDGYNSNTGSTWSQESRTYGNTRYIDGTDSRGNSFSKICNQFGCY